MDLIGAQIGMGSMYAIKAIEEGSQYSIIVSERHFGAILIGFKLRLDKILCCLIVGFMVITSDFLLDNWKVKIHIFVVLFQLDWKHIYHYLYF